MKPITLLKLGGSVITDKTTPYSAQRDVIARLAQEIKKYDKPLIISHGSGSFGHTSASLYGGKKGYSSKSGIAKLCFDASWINHIVMEEFCRAELAAIAVPPIGLVQTQAGKVRSQQFQIVEGFLRQGLIPVVYGDVINDVSWDTTIYSGEKVLSEIAEFLIAHGYEVDRVIQVGITDGFLDKEENPVSSITPATWNEQKEFLFTTSTKDVTGGMAHKVEEALSLTHRGITTYLINGLKEHELQHALFGKNISGTKIRPTDTKTPEKHEYVVAVDEENKPIGRLPKLAAHHGDTPRHRGFSVFLFNKDKKLLLQQRSHKKKTWPLVWSNSCCGHPMEGELPEDAAKRRLAYELGIDQAEILMMLPDYKYTCEKDGIKENEFCPVMVGVWEGSLKANPDEVEATKWISWKDWVKEVKTHPENYSQWCVEETLLLEKNERFNKHIVRSKQVSI